VDDFDEIMAVNLRGVWLSWRESLWAQHAEWLKSNCDSPICDLYERRLAELIAFFQSAKANVTTA
jgi:hypothetical protein